MGLAGGPAGPGGFADDRPLAVKSEIRLGETFAAGERKGILDM